MIITFIFGLLVYASAKPLKDNEVQKNRIPVGPIKFQASLDFMPKLNRTAVQGATPTDYVFVPKIHEAVDKGEYTVSFMFPKYDNPQKFDFYTFRLLDKFALITNGSMDNGIIGFRYRLFLPNNITSEVKWEDNLNDNQSVKLKALIGKNTSTSFTKRWLENTVQLENNMHKISTYLPGLTRDDIYLISTDEYLFTVAARKSMMSYEEARMWPPCSTKEFYGEYSKDELTTWIILDDNCLQRIK